MPTIILAPQCLPLPVEHCNASSCPSVRQMPPSLYLSKCPSAAAGNCRSKVLCGVGSINASKQQAASKEQAAGRQCLGKYQNSQSHTLYNIDALQQLQAGKTHHQCCSCAQVEYLCSAGRQGGREASILDATNEHCGRLSHSLIFFHGHYFRCEAVVDFTKSNKN